MTQPHQPTTPAIGDTVRLPATYGPLSTIDGTVVDIDVAKVGDQPTEADWAIVNCGKYGMIGALLADLRPAPNPNTATVHALMAVDKSGSMAPLANDVIGGYNGYLDGLTNADGIYRVTTILFDTEMDTIAVDLAPEDTPRLTANTSPHDVAGHATYRPGGATALLKAVAHTITTFEAAHPTLGVGERVLLVISTDGEENSSGPEHTWKMTNDMIDARVAGGQWASVYLGAGPQAWAQAGRFTASTHTVGTQATMTGTADTYRGLLTASHGYAAGQHATTIAATLRDATGLPDPSGDKD